MFISMYRFIFEIQSNYLEHFPQLFELFHPLIYAWLRKIHKLYSVEKEDYLSIAKIVLLECAKNYSFEKNVPFQSYFKIALYHWYGNQMKKKQLTTTNLDETMPPIASDDWLHELERKSELHQVAIMIQSLDHKEQLIFKKLMNGQSALEIARDLQLSKKTILNKKYIIINKLKKTLSESNQAKKATSF